MPVKPATSSPSSPSGELGYTLVELLVAMILSLIVAAALLAILEFSVDQESHISDRVQSDQIGRTAMANIVQELDSSCTGFGATAIQAPSGTVSSPLKETGPLNVWFLSAYGNSESENAVIEHNMVEHDINWTASGEKSSTGVTLGTLTDYRFSSTSGESPSWTFPALTATNAKAVVLATDVLAPEPSKTPTIFQYYKYNNVSTSSTDGQLEEIPSSEVQTAAKEKEIAEVTITFTQAPTSASTSPGSVAAISNSVVLRFEGTETGSEVTNKPCE